MSSHFLWFGKLRVKVRYYPCTDVSFFIVKAILIPNVITMCSAACNYNKHIACKLKIWNQDNPW